MNLLFINKFPFFSRIFVISLQSLKQYNMFQRLLEMAVKTEILFNLPVDVDYKIVNPQLGTMLGTMLAVAYINQNTPLRYICGFHHNSDDPAKDFFSVRKLSEGALRDDGSDYLDKKEL